jgi:hypothetical protein
MTVIHSNIVLLLLQLLLERDPASRPYASELIALDMFDDIPDHYIPRDEEEEASQSARNYTSSLSVQSEKPIAKFSIPRSIAVNHDKSIENINLAENAISEVKSESYPQDPKLKGKWVISNKVTVTETRSSKVPTKPS